MPFFRVFSYGGWPPSRARQCVYLGSNSQVTLNNAKRTLREDSRHGPSYRKPIVSVPRARNLSSNFLHSSRSRAPATAFARQLRAPHSFAIAAAAVGPGACKRAQDAGDRPEQVFGKVQRPCPSIPGKARRASSGPELQWGGGRGNARGLAVVQG